MTLDQRVVLAQARRRPLGDGDSADLEIGGNSTWPSSARRTVANSSER